MTIRQPACRANQIKNTPSTPTILQALGILACFLLPSCFNITENYHFNRDGSGSAEVVFDISTAMEMMDAFGDEEEAGNAAADTMMQLFENDEFATSLQQLEALPGIHSVENLSNKEAFVLGYRYRFEDAESFARAHQSMWNNGEVSSLLGSEQTIGAESTTNSFSLKKKKLTRVFEVGVPQSEEEDESFIEMAAIMFGSNYYTINYTFDRKVKKVSNSPYAQIGPDFQSVTLKVPMSELIKEKTSLGCEIGLK